MTNKKGDKKEDKRKQKGDKADTVTNKKGDTVTNKKGDQGRQADGRRTRCPATRRTLRETWKTNHSGKGRTPAVTHLGDK